MSEDAPLAETTPSTNVEQSAAVPLLDYLNPAQPPTRIRFGVLGFLCILALLLYVDRICIGQAAAAMQAELHLSKAQMAWIFNAFTLAYCLFEVPTGHWGDRFGSRGVIARIALWWSIFTVLTGAALGFWSLLLIRFLFGAGEAGAYPNTARVVTRWFPIQARGFARGAVVFVSMLGAMIAPVVSAKLITHVGWRFTFAIFGAAGVAWSALFYAWFRDDPAAHPRVNAAERELIGPGSGPLQAAEDHSAIPWRSVLSGPNLWLLAGIMSANSVLFYMQFQWFPTYLKTARHQGEMASGWYTAMVMAGGAIGCVAGGLLADVVVRRTRERRWSQRLCGASALSGAALSVLMVHWVGPIWAVALCNASALFFVQLGIPTWWAAVASVSGRHGAAMWGLMNSMAGLAVMTTTPAIAAMVDQRLKSGVVTTTTWRPVFDGVAIVLAGGALCWMNVDVTRSIVTDVETDIGAGEPNCLTGD